MLEDNLSLIREHIAAAAEKSGRRAEDIHLIAATKTVEPARIRELLSLGVTRLGENRVQELLAKYDLFTPAPEWHMIGHLQTNKVKQIIDKVALIHSVDSIRLAETIDRCAGQAGRRINVLVEINIAGEDNKYGVQPEQTGDFVEQLSGFSNICVQGLMCIAPYVMNPEYNRNIYKKMSNIFVDIQTVFAHNMGVKYLSMGMSGDYRVAIEEGANMVRIGTALFGERG